MFPPEHWLRASDSRIALLIIDGLGGLPHPETGETELQSAETPFLDALSREASLGLLEPLAPGWTPGSLTGHLALFGYDPREFVVRRGPVEVLGAGFPLLPGDLAMRGNFVRMEGERIVDRRAGRLPTERAHELLKKLQERIPTIDGCQVIFVPGKEHRFGVVLRGTEVDGPVSDTDPLQEGEPPREPRPLRPEAFPAAQKVLHLTRRIRSVLENEPDANMAVFRGIDNLPEIPSFRKRYGIAGTALASHPMYRGFAKLLGLEVRETEPTVESYAQHLDQVRSAFLYVHWKPADTAGEDGNWEARLRALSAADRLARAIWDQWKPEVFCVTGDHATPARLRGHSFHPVPLLIASPRAYPSRAEAFHEETCRQGPLGRIRGLELFPLLLAHAGRLRKVEY